MPFNPVQQPNFGVFSLADVLAKKQEQQMNELKMQDYMRNQAQQQTLGDIFARSIETTGATPEIPAQPEQVMPEGILGPPRPATQAVPGDPGRTDLNWNAALAKAQSLPEAMRGPIVMQIHQARQAEEDRRMAMMLKMQQATEGRMRGVSDNDLAIVASGGQSGNAAADRLGKEGAIAALSRKPMLIPEGALVGNKGNPTAPGNYPNQKLLSKTDLDELRDLSTTYDNIKDLSKTFRPEFAGKGLDVFTNTSNFIASRGSDPLGRAQAAWARKYEALNNIERHKFFGSALTPTEVESWKRSIASLSQGSGNMQDHLRNLEQKASKVLAYTAKPRMVENYNQEQVREAIGGDTYDRLKGVTKPSADTWEDSQYQYRRLPDGTVQRKKK